MRPITIFITEAFFPMEEMIMDKIEKSFFNSKTFTACRPSKEFFYTSNAALAFFDLSKNEGLKPPAPCGRKLRRAPVGLNFIPYKPPFLWDKKTGKNTPLTIFNYVGTFGGKEKTLNPLNPLILLVCMSFFIFLKCQIWEF